MIKLHSNFRRFFSHRKIKIWKPKHYEAIPHYIRPESRDPFEYKLRTKEQFLKEHKTDPVLECKISYTLYNWAEGVYEDRNRKVRLEVGFKSMNLTPKQKERLIQLLGTRYKEGSDRLNLVCEMYPTIEQNLAKLKEMLRELYLEAKRAP